MERKQPSSVTGQCFGSYNNVLPEDKQLGQTNYNSLTWSNGSEMRCYICDVELNNENEKRSMQCEHFFALTEAMLFWRLHSDTQLKPKESELIGTNKDIINKMTVREYGPVCRKCNCEPYKSSLRIFKFNESGEGPLFILDEDSLIRIAYGDPSNDASVEHHDGSPTLDSQQRKSRLKKVFTPLVDSINLNLRGKENEEILDILIKRYFSYYNQTAIEKLRTLFLGGEDLEKLKKEQDKKNKKNIKVVSVLYKFFGKISSAEKKATALETEREKTSAAASLSAKQATSRTQKLKRKLAIRAKAIRDKVIAKVTAFRGKALDIKSQILKLFRTLDKQITDIEAAKRFVNGLKDTSTPQPSEVFSILRNTDFQQQLSLVTNRVKELVDEPEQLVAVEGSLMTFGGGGKTYQMIGGDGEDFIPSEYDLDYLSFLLNLVDDSKSEDTFFKDIVQDVEEIKKKIEVEKTNFIREMESKASEIAASIAAGGYATESDSREEKKDIREYIAEISTIDEIKTEVELFEQLKGIYTTTPSNDIDNELLIFAYYFLELISEKGSSTETSEIIIELEERNKSNEMNVVQKKQYSDIAINYKKFMEKKEAAAQAAELAAAQAAAQAAELAAAQAAELAAAQAAELAAAGAAGAVSPENMGSEFKSGDSSTGESKLDGADLQPGTNVIAAAASSSASRRGQTILTDYYGTSRGPPPNKKRRK